jgi:large subunit ribosomal protein L30
MADKTLKVTLVAAAWPLWQPTRPASRGLGLRRMHHTVEVIDTPENRGMINKVSYLLKVEEA